MPNNATPKAKLTGGDINGVIEASKVIGKMFPPKHGNLVSLHDLQTKMAALDVGELHALNRAFASLHTVADKFKKVEFKTA